MGERSFIAGHGLIVYSNQYFGTMSPRRYGKLIEMRTKETMKQKFKDAVKGYLPRDKVEKLLKQLA